MNLFYNFVQNRFKIEHGFSGGDSKNPVQVGKIGVSLFFGFFGRNL